MKHYLGKDGTHGRWLESGYYILLKFEHIVTLVFSGEHREKSPCKLSEEYIFNRSSMREKRSEPHAQRLRIEEKGGPLRFTTFLRNF